MISEEKLARDIQVISQQAWGVPTNTTVNALVEYIVREAFLKVLPELATLEDQLMAALETLEKYREELEDGKNGRVSQPEGSTESTRTVRKSRSK